MWLGTSSNIGDSSNLHRLDQFFPSETDEQAFKKAENIRVRFRGGYVNREPREMALDPW